MTSLNSNLIRDLERRRSVRLPQEIPVSFKFVNSNREYRSLTKNIAKDGVYIKADLLKRDLHNLLFVKLEFSDYQKNLFFNAQIVWVDSEDNQKVHGFGIKFLKPAQDIQEYLEGYILNQLNLPKQSINKSDLAIRDIYLELSEKERRSFNMLDTVRRRGPVSKAEIAKFINLNIGTISNYIEEYIKKQIIFDKGLDVSSGGRRPSLLELNEVFAYTIGVDIKDFITVCLLDAKGNIINKLKQETRTLIDQNEVGVLVNELVLTSRINSSLIKAIGLVKSPKVASYNNLSSVLSEKFNLPVFLIDNSSACVFAEYWINSDLADSRNIVYLSLADFSCGLILNKEVYYPAQLNTTNYFSLINNVLVDKSLNLPDKQKLNEAVFLKIINIIDLLNPDIIIIDGLNYDALGDEIQILKERIGKLSEAFKYTKIIMSSLLEYTSAIGAAAILTREVFIQS